MKQLEQSMEYREKRSTEYQKEQSEEYQKERSEEYQKERSAEYQEERSAEYQKERSEEYQKERSEEHQEKRHAEYRRKRHVKYQVVGLLAIAVFGGVFLSIGYVNPYEKMTTLSEIILQLSGSRGEFCLGFSMPELLSLALRMIPDFVLEMYLGTQLYRHFCTACVYVFSRYTGRIAWYCREVVVLAGQVLVCQAVLLATVLLVSVLRNDVRFDRAGSFLLAEHFILKSLWILGMVLCINLFGIVFGSNLSFMGVMGAQTACITLLGIAGTVGRTRTKVLGSALLKGNPMAYMVLGWRNGGKGEVWELLEQGVLKFGKWEALLLYLFLCVGIILAGAVFVKRRDLLCAGAEEGEV